MNQRSIQNSDPLLKVSRMLVLNARHITAATLSNFETCSDDTPPFFVRAEWGDRTVLGWMIPIRPESPWSHMISDDLMTIRAFAENAGCDWIMIEEDGPFIDSLPLRA